MATPFKDPRTGVLYFRRGVPEPLRPAFDGKALVKVSLRTKDPAIAKIGFARENAAFEERLAEARRLMAEGMLVPTPGALVRRWFETPATKPGLSGGERLIATLMELDATVGGSVSAGVDDIFPPATYGPAANTDWSAVHASRDRYDAMLDESYEGNPEKVGNNWIRARWHEDEPLWRPALAGPITRLRAADPGADRFSDDELGKAFLAQLDDKRTGDEELNRARLADRRPRVPQPRLRPTMRLKTLFNEWKAGNQPRLQSAQEYEASVDDFIDFAGDIAVSTIDADLLFDYRDAAKDLPSSMPRADRQLPFRERLKKHASSLPKCSPQTLKKRIGALQALLTYAFQQRWIATNTGVGITIIGYSKTKKKRRSSQDGELTQLCAAPLFTNPSSWASASRISDATLFWIFLIAITTGARLEEVGQLALADVKRDGDMIYLDIDEYAFDDDGENKSVKTEGSIRLIPVHRKLIDLGFLDYCETLRRLGQTQLFPDLKENKVGKRTKEASQRANRVIDRYVSEDKRLVFYSTRHAFKAKGNDAGITDKTLDQICGHAPVSTGGRYGSEPRIHTLHEALHRIDFSCIAWDAILAAMSEIDWAARIKLT
ncbi:site-specific integrase [Sphingomonas sp. 3P27F8]|uniref:site-specific integrase n=1 Tax=Sphingomonas sp. 3P27F8 TaxID=2502213 RepID=UPI0014858616|nr:site-specific integrase [Sphingomonas sp. 3P27F8]